MYYFWGCPKNIQTRDGKNTANEKCQFYMNRKNQKWQIKNVSQTWQKWSTLHHKSQSFAKTFLNLWHFVPRRGTKHSHPTLALINISTSHAHWQQQRNEIGQSFTDSYAACLWNGNEGKLKCQSQSHACETKKMVAFQRNVFATQIL